MLPHIRLTLLLLTFTLSILATHQSNVPPAASCEGYNATQNLLTANPKANCLETLSDPSHASQYDVCKSQPCFLFRWSTPSVWYDRAAFNASVKKFQRPFRCKEPGALHPSVGGIVFRILERVVPDNALCIWAGPEGHCAFNALVDYTAVMAEQGYQFAIAGLLLDLPKRRCNHVLSAPIHDNHIVIVGKRDSALDHPLYQLARPFRLWAWLIIAAVVIMFFVVCWIVVATMGSLRTDGRFLTALQMFTGNLDLPVYKDGAGTGSGAASGRGYSIPYLKKHRNRKVGRRCHGRRRRRKSLYRSKNDDAETEDEKSTEIARNNLSVVLFRIALGAFFGVFLLFYEVAIVNFLFQQNSMKLSRSIEFLSEAELRKYSVLRNSAQEVVFLETVNRNGNAYDLKRGSDIPWKRCNSEQECIQWVVDDSNETEYAVTYETKGKFLIHTESSCNKLAILETENALYDFSSAWLYTRDIDREFIELIDRQIVHLRIQGELSMIESVTGKTCKPVPRADIGPSIIVVPFAFVVIPLLVGSLYAKLFWRRKRRDENVVRRDVLPGDSSATDMSLDSWEV